ncbi:hypothetical protein KUCAC02_025110 [Chaenocephalus aceratus]|nr:hypothetical protein KUCAC02_025110 [Chaenocephalus aceratus]
MGTPSPPESAFASWYSLPGLSHCQPTPFSCGAWCGLGSNITEEFKRSLVEWALAQNGTSCLSISVQHTLYYHAPGRQYKIMVSHTVMDNDPNLNIFRL